MKRQGMEVSVKELRKLADRLEKELQEDNEHNLDIDVLNQGCIVAIINKTGASDDWKFERIKK